MDMHAKSWLVSLFQSQAAKLLFLRYRNQPCSFQTRVPILVMASAWTHDQGITQTSPELSPASHVYSHPLSKIHLTPHVLTWAASRAVPIILYVLLPLPVQELAIIWKWPSGAYSNPLNMVALSLTSECCCQLTLPITGLACATGVCLSFISSTRWVLPRQ